jgi:hypothetical protein
MAHRPRLLGFPLRAQPSQVPQTLNVVAHVAR